MRSVLAVGAHPDDIELGCGGTLAAHRCAGDTVTMLVLTGGQNGPGSCAERRREQERAARVLDAVLIWGRLVDCALAPDAATVTVVENALRSVAADIVYVHAPEDSHQDHRAAATATLAAARHRNRILYYRSPSTTEFNPTMYVDISAHLDRKVEAIACHRTQVAASAMVDPEVVAASARHFGAQARTRYAEAFVPARFVWDLSATHADAPAGSTALVGTLPAW
ncbi:N-acetylglucosaminyl deacetylase, LmbE family [Micromonospora pattaloongensis]|uniref:N-acetylglucosaminyl deacetylase, LmbE family n=1 Tax=Micromonospora pattaloongensis TaxID=405436 RepID=A0A1H3LVS2_9ACTN|nr:PIG-L family deacetylase [Micromonospora pattaloongensis]SDY68637.1 N-acetylglucosaminyl deacetylase, LmbE family [Micromonospora pattaloongensis]